MLGGNSGPANRFLAPLLLQSGYTGKMLACHITTHQAGYGKSVPLKWTSCDADTNRTIVSSNLGSSGEVMSNFDLINR